MHTVSKGFPRGGVLSPLLWIVFFNAVLSGLEARAPAPEGTGIRRLHLVYADDVTALVSTNNLGELKAEAHLVVDLLRGLLAQLGLELNDQKTHNNL